jgi:uncharacterized protein (DUF983 family)
MPETTLPALEPASMSAAHPAPVRWSPASPDRSHVGWARPGLTVAMLRGFGGHCPCCGQGTLFTGWLRQVPECRVCAAPLGGARADDAPPYFVIFLVAHLVIGIQVMVDTSLNLSLAAEAAIFLPLTLFLCLALLRPVKGATVGLMMQMGMVQQATAEP